MPQLRSPNFLAMDLLQSASRFRTTPLLRCHPHTPSPLQIHRQVSFHFLIQSDLFGSCSQFLGFSDVLNSILFVWWIFRSNLLFLEPNTRYHRELWAAIDAVERVFRLCLDVISRLHLILFGSRENVVNKRDIIITCMLQSDYKHFQPSSISLKWTQKLLQSSSIFHLQNGDLSFKLQI